MRSYACSVIPWVRHRSGTRRPASPFTIARWKAKYGGLEQSERQRLKALEEYAKRDVSRDHVANAELSCAVLAYRCDRCDASPRERCRPFPPRRKIRARGPRPFAATPSLSHAAQRRQTTCPTRVTTHAERGSEARGRCEVFPAIGKGHPRVGASWSAWRSGGRRRERPTARAGRRSRREHDERLSRPE